MDAKIEQGLRVITQRDEELAELRAMKKKEKQSHDVELTTYKDELEKLKFEMSLKSEKIGELQNQFADAIARVNILEQQLEDQRASLMAGSEAQVIKV